MTQVPKTAPPRNQGLPPAEGPTTTGVPTAADFKVGASPLPSLPAPAHVHSDPDNGADQAASVASAATISRVPGAETAKAVEKAAPPSSLTDQIQDSFRAHLDQLREAGRVEVQMDLHPPELGRVQMSIALHDGRIDVRFVVQNEAARSALDHQVEPLRVRFAEMGLSLSQFDVRRDGTSNQEPPAQPEVPAQVAQLATKEPARTRKAYDPVANSASVVDVMA